MENYEVFTYSEIFQTASIDYIRIKNELRKEIPNK